MPWDTLVASGAALLAAFLYATSNVVEQRTAAQAPPEASMRVGLLWHLAHRPSWWLGIAADVGGFGAQAVALVAGSLVFVQPLLVMSLLFSLTLGAAVGLHRLSRSDVAWATVLVVGLGVFLGVSDPSGGTAGRPVAAWVVPLLAVGGVVGGCILLAARTTGALRAALLGAAAGATFGVSSTLLKSCAHLVDDVGPLGALRHWEPYALGGVVAFGFLAVQSAFQAGDLRASLPALEVSEPVVAAALGIGLLHERLHADGLVERAVVALAAVAMGWAAIHLAGSAARDHDRSEVTVSEPSRSPTDPRP